MSEGVRMGAIVFGEHRQQLQESMYRKYYHMVRRYFRAHVHCGCDVEDLTQNVFARLLRSGRVPEEPQAYIYTVARNELRSYWQERRRRDKHGSPERPLEEHPLVEAAHDLEPLSQLQHRDEHRMVLEALSHLPPSLASTLRLCVMEGRSLCEVAQLSGCSYDATKKRLQRAKQLFRELYPDMWHF